MLLPLFSLLLGAFSIGTTELVVAGILPAIAADLGVTIPDAGLLVSGYAIGVAFGGPALMVLNLDEQVTQPVLDKISALPGFFDVKVVSV